MATKTRKHSCLLTRDEHDDAIKAKDEHAESLREIILTGRYCLGIEQARGTWQLWLYEYERGDDD